MFKRLFVKTLFFAVIVVMTNLLRQFVGPASAVPSPGEIDQFVLQEMMQKEIPGLSIAVVRNGKVIYIKGYGFADSASRSPAAPQTVYLIASLSKQFTAAAVMLLVQDGKLGLDEKIAPLLPQVTLPKSWDRLTVRELLNQTTGLVELDDYVDLDKPDAATPQSIIDSIKGQPLAFTSGSAFKYSNTNFYLAAKIVEAVSGESFYTFMQRRLFGPLAMNSTRMNNPAVANLDRATGYLLYSGKVSADFTPIAPVFLLGCGGIETNVVDLARWDAALYRNSPLTAQSKEAMWSPPALSGQGNSDYGFGWLVEKDSGHRLIWHNGALPGVTCWMGRYVDDKLTVIVLSNLRNIDQPIQSVNDFSELGKGIAGLYVPAVMPLSVVKPSSKATISPKILAICKKAIADVYSGQPDPAMYTSDTVKALFPDALNQTSQLFKSLGPEQSFEPLFQKSESGMIELTCRITFGSTKLVYMFVLTPDTNLIAGIMPQN
jgi:CubicO group peptidase (beta-lactamase class C family)